MKGSKEFLKNRYLAIQADYIKMDKKDDKGRSLYSYTNLLKQLSDKFHYCEKTIQTILLMDIEDWFKKKIKTKKGVDENQTNLF